METGKRGRTEDSSVALQLFPKRNGVCATDREEEKGKEEESRETEFGNGCILDPIQGRQTFAWTRQG